MRLLVHHYRVESATVHSGDFAEPLMVNATRIPNLTNRPSEQLVISDRKLDGYFRVCGTIRDRAYLLRWLAETKGVLLEAHRDWDQEGEIVYAQFTARESA